jgi:hypothetical protein
VTNTLINYITGLKAPPGLPLELQPHLGKANPGIYLHSNLDTYRSFHCSSLHHWLS